ncbi:MAG: alpha/beta fold hydrolase [Deltaproteobacteria bacterium]|nr:alpha/beta fold hydrolase [Deltaproteobacteria bacterium]MBI3389331.1 alpha/beta fold hydrolase [Deltaproteobacteria bacterium]
MEPEIRYVRSADGTSIATWKFGAGSPLVVPMLPLAPLQLHWCIPEVRRGFELLAQQRTVVMYDSRGCGLSDRAATDFSLAAMVFDLEAVARGHALDRIDLLARGPMGAIAITYAAQPDRVRRLVLVNGVARGKDFRMNAERRALGQLIAVNFELYCQTLALVDFGWTETARLVAAESAKGCNTEILTRWWTAQREWDASMRFPEVRCPTRIMHQPSPSGGVGLDAMRKMAAMMPDARLSIRARPGPILFVEDPEAVAQEILDFLDEDQRPGTVASLPSGIAIILFADIVDSTGLTESLGDAAFRAKARELDDAMRAAIRTCGGTPVDGKLVGDGVLAVFSSASQAIDAALRCGAAGDGVGLKLHLGIHAGDVIREDNNVYGGAVNIAARISALSAPGEVLVSDTVRNLARTSVTATFADRGEQTLKGVSEPVHLFAIAPSLRQ